MREVQATKGADMEISKSGVTQIPEVNILRHFRGFSVEFKTHVSFFHLSCFYNLDSAIYSQNTNTQEKIES